ncbi:MAG: heat-inducible transcriptional repressor HrcA [Actinomycetes bacterium]
MLEDRRLEVLRAIVEDFVRTQEPVGSKSLAGRPGLGVSPATIRNDMAALEEEGFLAQPHTSAGRVPTDKGYRLFVDRLTAIKPLSGAERRAISTFLDGAVDLDDVVSRTVRLLAQLTRQVAVVQYPSLTRSAVRHIELVAISTTRVLLVVIADTGRVEQRVVESPGPVDETTLAGLRIGLNQALAGQPFTDVGSRVTDMPERYPWEDRALVTAVLSTLLEATMERHEERVALGGTANLARLGPDFASSLRPVLEALEEQVVLLRLLGEATDPRRVTVLIGHENPLESLASTSVVSVGYGTAEQTVAKLGVLGPTRMDYPGSIGAVRAVAQYLGHIIVGS